MIKAGTLLISDKILKVIRPKKKRCSTFVMRIKEFGRYRAWFLEGKRHRTNGPAVVWPDGSYIWKKYGFFYRDDGPSVFFKGEEGISNFLRWGNYWSQKKWFQELLEERFSDEGDSNERRIGWP